MNIQHTYFDADYGYYYCVPNQEQISAANAVTFRQTTFSRDDTASYIVAKWVPNSDYDIETGVLKINRPIVDEYFYPDLSLRNGKFYRSATSTVPLNLPYLSGEGLSTRDPNIQPPMFQSVNITLTQLDQSNWPSCRHEPDQPVVWPPKTCA